MWLDFFFTLFLQLLKEPIIHPFLSNGNWHRKNSVENSSVVDNFTRPILFRLLTLQDVYCEEQMGVVIDDILLQVHILGQGWMFADSHFGKPSSIGSIQSSFDDF
ncbi:hypothetical protein ACH5RR_041787 [Cinchona calisaya]|uniref:Uncharacterized protein n=1 Tax=Cinchona calisaya TaxID=153742 RepID=A0ABD2XXQ3_9GENT